MTSKATNQAFKAQLQGLQERYLQPLLLLQQEGDEGDKQQSSLPLPWKGLFYMELALRGVLSPMENEEDMDPFWKAISSAVGKPMYDSSLPNPLWAGALVLAGKMAEAVANAMDGSCSHSTPAVTIPPFVLQRCKDIDDPRWKALLSFLQPPSQTSIPPDPSPAAAERKRQEQLERRRTLCFGMALGNVTRGAHLQQTLPALWKKVWDLWTHTNEEEADVFDSSSTLFSTILLAQSNTTNDDTTTASYQSKLDLFFFQELMSQSSPYVAWEAQLAISNMKTIAHSKGNAKRVAELQSKLWQAQLINPSNQQQQQQSSLLLYETATTFAVSDDDDDLKVLNPPLQTTTNSQDTHAVRLKTLQSIHQQLKKSSDAGIHHQLLLGHTLLLLDRQIMEGIALEEYQQSKHKAKSKTLAQCRQQATVKHHRAAPENNDEWTTTLATLMTFVTQWQQQQSEKGDDNDEVHSYGPAAMLVTQQMLMQFGFHRAHAQDTIPVWTTLLQQCITLLQSYQTTIGWIPTEDKATRLGCIGAPFAQNEDARTISKALIATVTTLFTKGYVALIRLGQAAQPGLAQLEGLLSFAKDILLVLIELTTEVETKQRQTKNNALQSSSKAVGSSTSPTSQLLQTWRSVWSLTLCALAQDNLSSIRTLANIKTTAKADSCWVEEADPLWRCLVAWSGWFQTPFGACANITHARRIVTAARDHVVIKPRTVVEDLLLQLASADVELMDGGFVQRARDLFQAALKALLEEKTAASIEKVQSAILQSHCHNGLAKVARKLSGSETELSAEESTGTALALLESVEEVLQEGASSLSLYFWYQSEIFASCVVYQKSMSRKTIADSLVEQGRIDEAKQFLEEAVRDAPLDAEAAKAHGAFLLQMAMYNKSHPDLSTPESLKKAQIQLLKAAKIDPSRPDPFSLLGIWFEHQGDEGRAAGCFTKALVLDSAHPVAGRGLLRLKGRTDEMASYVEIATQSNSALNGWAWRETAWQLFYKDGDEELSVIALLKAMRSHDVAKPDTELLGVFYSGPDTSESDNEFSDALSELGLCYHRLGRYTAALRALQTALESQKENPSSSALCRCAQVELDLGLFESAAEKYDTVLSRNDDPFLTIAAYGHGLALSSLARGDLEDGKAGAAFDRAVLAIEACESLPTCNSASLLKLLGDLYSFGARLPPNVFAEDDEEASSKQMSFVGKGEGCYRNWLEGIDNDFQTDKAAASTDVGTNILCQLQLISHDSQLSDSDQLVELSGRAESAFKTALECDPLYAPAWCGLGCSMLEKDPVMAQHAFYRSGEVDKQLADPYSNLGILYTSEHSFEAADEMLNAVTQIADSPLTWVTRAYVLERLAKQSLDNGNHNETREKLIQVRDSYKASLQLTKFPDALLGLALAGRHLASGVVESESSRQDSLMALKEFIGASSTVSAESVALLSTMEAEQSLLDGNNKTSWKSNLFAGSSKQVESAAKQGNDVQLPDFSPQQTEEGKDALSTPSHSFPFDIDLQRQILHSPNSPKLWLDLAKAMLDKVDMSSQQSLVSLDTAANRAAKLYRLSFLGGPQGDSGCVDCYALAESLSLAHIASNWLPASFPTKDDSDKVEDKVANEDNQGAEVTDVDDSGCAATLDLQRAWMMCPNNKMVREVALSSFAT